MTERLPQVFAEAVGAGEGGDRGGAAGEGTVCAHRLEMDWLKTKLARLGAEERITSGMFRTFDEGRLEGVNR